MKTLTGLDEAAMAATLDEQFPAAAYKAIPGGADLTDIDAGYMRDCLNRVFGLCGMGWGYAFNPDQVRMISAGKGVDVAILDFTFWYKLVNDAGEPVTFEIPATGGSDNRNASYALKGAVTNCIGHAASNLGFQKSIYMGLRSAGTVKATGRGPVSGGAKAAVKPVPGGNGNGSNGAKAPVAAQPPAAAPAANNGKLAAARAFVMPFGTNKRPDLKGQPLGALEDSEPTLVDFLAANTKNAGLKAALDVIIAAREPVAA